MNDDAYCAGPHSEIAEYTQGAAVGPQIYSDCSGCMRQPQELQEPHVLAQSDLPVRDLLRAVDTRDVQHAPAEAEASKPPERDVTAMLGEAPYCSAKTRRRGLKNGRCGGSAK